jgi:hypothetical protein
MFEKMKIGSALVKISLAAGATKPFEQSQLNNFFSPIIKKYVNQFKEMNVSSEQMAVFIFSETVNSFDHPALWLLKNENPQLLKEISLTYFGCKRLAQNAPDKFGKYFKQINHVYESYLSDSLEH